MRAIQIAPIKSIYKYNFNSAPTSWTQLHRAASSNYINKIDQLIKKDPKLLNKRDNLGCTPLHVAILFNRYEAAQALLKAGADVNAYDYKKQSPLYFAVRDDQIALVKLLISYKAVVDSFSIDNLTPLFLASQKSCKKIENILCESVKK